jgi:hypothetical protein
VRNYFQDGAHILDPDSGRIEALHNTKSKPYNGGPQTPVAVERRRERAGPGRAGRLLHNRSTPGHPRFAVTRGAGLFAANGRENERNELPWSSGGMPR